MGARQRAGGRGFRCQDESHGSAPRAEAARLLPKQELGGRSEPSPHWCPPSQTSGPDCRRTLGKRPPPHQSEALAPGSLPPWVSSSSLPTRSPAAILSEIPPTVLEVTGPGSFQEILFLDSPLTFGLGLAPGQHCFVLGCFYCYSLKNLEPGCPGALTPSWAGQFPCGQGPG